LKEQEEEIWMQEGLAHLQWHKSSHRKLTGNSLAQNNKSFCQKWRESFPHWRRWKVRRDIRSGLAGCLKPKTNVSERTKPKKPQHPQALGLSSITK